MLSNAIGIDVGGTGIKAAIVEIRTGELLTERLRVETPAGGEPNDIAAACNGLIEQLAAPSNLTVGLCFPAVVTHGITRSAANVSDAWIGLKAEKLFTKALSRNTHVLNDADAAGVAEMKFGAGRKAKGVTIMTTLGTGIGSALFLNKKLVPNTELGHLDIGEIRDFEQYASFAQMEAEGLSFEQWAERLEIFYAHLERLFSPDLFIVGGGISKSHESFLPLITTNAPIVPATTRNAAGIIGAAAMAAKVLK